jgi:DNA-binding NarL/FixJ family response regulator
VGAVAGIDGAERAGGLKTPLDGPHRTGEVLSPTMTIRVVLAEDSLIVREGVRQLLAADEEIEVVAAVGDMTSVHEACVRDRPDVVVTDIRMPPTKSDEGIRLATELRDLHPEVGVVVLSQYSDPAYALALLDGGSDGRAYLLKHRVHNRAELTAAIKAVAAKGSVIDSHIVDALVSARAQSAHSPLSELTAREREVLAEIAQGKSNAAIAESLFLTKRAVEKHINAIFVKLGLAHADDVTVSKRVKATLMLLAENGVLSGASVPR